MSVCGLLKQAVSHYLLQCTLMCLNVLFEEHDLNLHLYYGEGRMCETPGHTEVGVTTLTHMSFLLYYCLNPL